MLKVVDDVEDNDLRSLGVATYSDELLPSNRTVEQILQITR